MDSKSIYYLDVCKVQEGFFATWTTVSDYKLMACLLRWEEEHLVAYPPMTVDVGGGLCYFLVMDQVSENRVILAYNIGSSGYKICARVADVSADGGILFGPECILQNTSSSSYQIAIRMASSSSGFLAYAEYDSPTYFNYGISITIDGTAISSSPTLEIVQDAASNLRYFTANSVDCLDSKALFMSSNYGTTSSVQKIFYINNTDTPTVIKNEDYAPDNTVRNSTQAIRFIDSNLALACWVGVEQRIFWRLINLTENNMMLGNWDDLGNLVAPYQVNNRPTLELVVVSQNTVALFMAGTTALYPKVVFGTVSEDRQTMIWGKGEDLPLGIKFSSYIKAAYHPDEDAFVFVAGSSSLSPIALTIKM